MPLLNLGYHHLFPPLALLHKENFESCWQREFPRLHDRCNLGDLLMYNSMRSSKTPLAAAKDLG